MKMFIVSLLVVLSCTCPAFSQQPVDFDQVFVDSTLRVDYFRTGDAKEEVIAVDQVLRQERWAGNPRKLLDPFGRGHYYVKLYDTTSNALLYSRGYDAIFDEYRTTEPAGRGVKRTFHESVLLPCPAKPVRMVIESRDSQNVFHPIFSRVIDPRDYHIITASPDTSDRIFAVQKGGDPHDALDLVFVAEGYAEAEVDTFRVDLQRYKEILLGQEPYRSHREKINISGVFRPSPESGVTQPRQGVYRNSVVRSSFNALDSDRYLLTEENRILRDIASAVPYDALCVMVNSKRYGGGGLYNNYTIFTTRNEYSHTVFLHEFGHGFAGLGDEYYASDVSYMDFFPRGVEPVEPNLTALLDGSLKWKDLVTPGTEIPTVWAKAEYDSLQHATGEVGKKRQALAARLQGVGAFPDSIENERRQLDNQMRRMRQRVTDMLLNSPLKGKVGAFEGAGYMLTGLYRPSVNCMMFSNEEKAFCKVCERAVADMITHFAE